MSQAQNSNELTKLTSEDCSAKQFYFVQMDANGLVEVAESATDLLLGILQKASNLSKL